MPTVRQRRPLRETQYRQQVSATIEAHGGATSCAVVRTEVLEGDWGRSVW